MHTVVIAAPGDGDVHQRGRGGSIAAGREVRRVLLRLLEVGSASVGHDEGGVRDGRVHGGKGKDACFLDVEVSDVPVTFTTVTTPVATIVSLYSDPRMNIVS